MYATLCFLQEKRGNTAVGWDLRTLLGPYWPLMLLGPVILILALIFAAQKKSKSPH